MSALHVVDLSAVRPDELEQLWQDEAQLWHERLCWTIADPLYWLQRMVERGAISGKILRKGTQAAGYACYVVVGALGVISRLVISPECDAHAAEMLIRETVGALRRTGVSRIEGSFIAADSTTLPQVFERLDFQTYWREFLRRPLYPAGGYQALPQHVYLEEWRNSNLQEAASVMRAAYEGGVDAELNEYYRSVDGCEVVLGDILNQGACGNPVVRASVIGRHRGRAIGFILMTEIHPRHAHLAQIAVLPGYQHQGVGRMLLTHCFSILANQAFDRVSLIVSRLNRRALNMYERTGFEPVLSFPVFVWQPRST
jgi:ribosomal protein S18 acetylase RimI-like enzyme